MSYVLKHSSTTCRESRVETPAKTRCQFLATFHLFKAEATIGTVPYRTSTVPVGLFQGFYGQTYDVDVLGWLSATGCYWTFGHRRHICGAP
eukprot:scaffold286776_cov20-Prasinocladus_malaysianus.AAC.1